jgi:hypothetical protein
MFAADHSRRISFPCLALAFLALMGSVLAQEKSPADEVAKTRKRIEDNTFTTDRALFSSNQILPGLVEDVATWTKDMRILDAGAGDAGLIRSVLTLEKDLAQMRSLPKAQLDQYVAGTIEYLAKAKPPASMPRFVAVSAKRPSMYPDAVKALDEDLETYAENFIYKEGWLGKKGLAFEKELGLGTFDRIICGMGASSYTDDFETMILGFGSLLKAGGRMLIYTNEHLTTFFDVNGRRISMGDYLSFASGLKVIRSTQADSQGRAIEVERTEGELRLTPLNKRFFGDATPPRRSFRETEPVVPPSSQPRSLGVRLLARLGERVDLGKDKALASELEAAGARPAGNIIRIDTDLLEKAVHSDWKKLLGEIPIERGDFVPVVAAGSQVLGHMGRVVEVLPDGRLRVAIGNSKEGFADCSLADLREAVLAEKIVAFETAFDLLTRPDRTTWRGGWEYEVSAADRTEEAVARLKTRGIPVPGGDASFFSWVAMEAGPELIRSYGRIEDGSMSKGPLERSFTRSRTPGLAELVERAAANEKDKAAER